MFTAQDPFGNPLTLQHQASAAAMTGFVDGFIGYQPSILAVLGAAESDDSLVLQFCLAAMNIRGARKTNPV